MGDGTVPAGQIDETGDAAGSGHMVLRKLTGFTILLEALWEFPPMPLDIVV
jgi:hypothetical protein